MCQVLGVRACRVSSNADTKGMETTTETRSALDLVREARAAKPGVRYAHNESGTAVAGWDSDQGRWVPVAGLGIDGAWYSVPFEVLANGEPMHRQEDWIEVEQVAT